MSQRVEFEQCDSYGPTDQGAEHEAQRCYLRAGHDRPLHLSRDGQEWDDEQAQPRGPLPVERQCGAAHLEAPGVPPNMVFHCRLPADHGGKLHHGHRPHYAPGNPYAANFQTEAVWPVEQPTTQLDPVAGINDEPIRADALHSAVRYYEIDGVTVGIGTVANVFEQYIRTGTWPEAWL